MGIKRDRNRECVPYLDGEGVYEKPLGRRESAPCGQGMTFWERMHAQQTLASARRYAHFKRHPFQIPIDELDFVLASTYNHAAELFAGRDDCLLQPETQDLDTWRRLRNTKDRMSDFVAIDHLKTLTGNDSNTGVPPYQLNAAHPIIIGGIIEKVHPSYVKLMNSSHHMPQTNAGFSRQDSDGNEFHY